MYQRIFDSGLNGLGDEEFLIVKNRVKSGLIRDENIVDHQGIRVIQKPIFIKNLAKSVGYLQYC